MHYVYTTIHGIENVTAHELYEFTPNNDSMRGGYITDNAGVELYILTEKSRCKCAHLEGRDTWKFSKNPPTLENE